MSLFPAACFPPSDPPRHGHQGTGTALGSRAARTGAALPPHSCHAPAPPAQSVCSAPRSGQPCHTQKGDPTKQTWGGAGARLVDQRPNKAGKEVLCAVAKAPGRAQNQTLQIIQQGILGSDCHSAASPPQAREPKLLASLPSTHRTWVTGTGRCVVCRPDQSPGSCGVQSPCKIREQLNPQQPPHLPCS